MTGAATQSGAFTAIKSCKYQVNFEVQSVFSPFDNIGLELK